MPTKFGKLIAVALLLSTPLAVAGCAEWQGSKTIDTDNRGDAEGHGPGLFSGKEGGFVIYNEVWTGAAPGGGAQE